ncbi:MAG: hypothetical protein ACE5FT_02595 [Candidatus Nanoarchaeia archaeon]
MDLWTDEEIRGKILHKLLRKGKLWHSHTSIDQLPKSFPGHMEGRVKAQVVVLVKERILLIKPTHYGKEVSIDPSLKPKVMYYIEKFLEK